MIEPIEFRDDWAPDYLKPRGDLNIDKAYTLPDPEGAWSTVHQKRLHGGWDIFAPAGTPVRAPRAGTIVRTYSTDDRSGPVYGGIIALRFEGEDSGVLFRHVDPRSGLGAGHKVNEGDIIAHVTNWTGGSPHAHMEMHRVIGQGRTYSFDNFFDPGRYTYRKYVPRPRDRRYGLEELPMPYGKGPKLYGGWSRLSYARLVQAALRVRYPKLDVTVESFDLPDKPRTFGVVVWPIGEDKIPRWFFHTESERDIFKARRVLKTGRKQRPFLGREKSLYRRIIG